MAQLLAPYNNSMRLGQGFNSYTQQICLDRAVLPDSTRNKERLARIANERIPGVEQKPNPEPDTPTPDGSLQHVGNSPGHNNTIDPVEEARKAVLGAKTGRDPINRPPWVKPQIVTYSSRFVDKLSDVTEAMNISGSLSIKTATIGGKANGSYVDSDKFKASDINFHLQVKVTNQVHDATDYTIFNKIEGLEDTQFPAVYGDTFISGWEEGGELNAIISMKVSDKSKITEIKAGLEAEITTATGTTVGVSGKFEMDKRNITSDTETTIAVNWSGGGSIKDPADEWTINTLKKTAAAFPDLVAITPQRTYAILTKYTALESFHVQMQTCKPLDYENAGIYTGSLLDHYMDYKVMWKQILNATYELEGNRATIEMAQPTQETCDLAVVRVHPTEEEVTLLLGGKAQTSSTPASTGSNAGPLIKKEDIAISETTVTGDPIKQTSEPFRYKVLSPSFAGLIQARKICRFEMSKIVKEVDLIARFPKLASDPGRDTYFLNPLVFKQLLPMVRVAPQGSALGHHKNPNAALILGYCAPPVFDRFVHPVQKIETPFSGLDIEVQKSLTEVKGKSADYRIHGFGGPVKTMHSRAVLVNDLVKLDPTFRPTQISAWYQDSIVKRVQLRYANGNTISHGAPTEGLGAATHELSLDHEGSEVIHEVAVQTAKDQDGNPVIAAFSVATSLCRTLNTDSEPSSLSKKEDVTVPKEDKKGEEKEGTSSAPPPPPDRKLKELATYRWSVPDFDQHWSLRGLFSITFNNTLTSIGVVWGKDQFIPVPACRIAAPLSADFLHLSPDLRKSISTCSIPGPKAFPGKFIMGHSVSIQSSSEPEICFNSLDHIDHAWKLKTLSFHTEEEELSGITAEYFNGSKVKHGFCNASKAAWTVDVSSDLVTAKLTAAKQTDDETGFVNSVEFIRANETGRLPEWLLDVSTLRYIADEEYEKTYGVNNVSKVVEKAPKMYGASWCVRGFYGECADGVITRLGVIWGRD